MSLTRRSTFAAAAGVMIAAFPWISHLWASDRPLRIVVGFQAGGTGDVIARLVGYRLGSFGTSVIIENKPGAAGVTAANFVLTTDDDHTLLIVSETYVVTPLINPNANFNLARDFRLIGIVAEGPQVLLAANDAPFRTFDEFERVARSTVTGLDYATSGFGHPQHLIGEYLTASLQAKLVHLPTRGGAAAVRDLLAGTVKVAILGLGPTFRLIEAGKLVPLAVSTATRSPALPGVPTLSELGFDQFSAPQWLGFVAPRTMGDNRVNELSHQLAKALADPATHQRLSALGFQPLFHDGPAMSLRIAGEEQRWQSIVATAKLTRQ